MITLYGIKNCDSVKKAKKFLDANNIAYTFVDFRATPVDESKIQSWLEKTDIDTLLNTRGTTYRKLKLKEQNLDSEGKLAWLAKENTLIKRPVLEYGDIIHVGFKEERYTILLKV